STGARHEAGGDHQRPRRGGPRPDGRRDRRRRRDRAVAPGRVGRQVKPPRADPLSGSEAMAALADAWPRDGIAVVETPSSTLALRNRLRLSTPGSYYFCASGGLGYGISAAGGGQLAQPSRPVVCVLGEGSAQY